MTRICQLRATSLAAGALLLVGPLAAKDTPEPVAGVQVLRQQQAELLIQLQMREPATPYVVIDTQDNRLMLRSRAHRQLREAACATGAGRRFEGPKRRHRWQFATPKGRFRVLRKERDPMWIKPEWAFVESNQKIPVFAEDRRRFQRGVLGEYALYFAREYMIHGTLYEMNLGKSITHGCVRVGAEDLTYLYEHVALGYPVYIY